ncbi:vanin-like protein 1 [Culicoides brevitarsis]|uniref:vanin-like protein 1 n=1 Tax=Culicoides brevitarsis TaxID=469753 RepID=UPI00307B2ADA
MISKILLLTFLASGAFAHSTPDSSTYVAGAVEYEKIRHWTEPHREAEENLAEYTKIILAPETKDVDILVFPESSLNNLESAVFVPDPQLKVNPCESKDYFDVIIKNVSCAARKSKKYVLINLTEKANCDPKSDKNCPETKLKRFNTNVVFDREGIVVSMYRKVNLFGETGISRPEKPESIPFETDFGVTFGQFICFDLMFELPAVQLVRDGVKDFLYPTMWFSELPFLTAVQAQQGWAFKNSVNFIASGASFPTVGSTGTGIYHGKSGALTAVMNFLGSNKVYIAEIPKKQSTNHEFLPEIKYFDPMDMLKLKLKRDQLDVYNTSIVNFSQTNQNHEICSEKFCCKFDLDTEILETSPDSPFYIYRIAAYDGIRTFDGFADGAVKVCGVIACTDDSLKSCGTRHQVPVHDKLKFNSIKIRTSYKKDDNILFMPSTLDAAIMPFESKDYGYEEKSGENGEIQIFMELKESKTDLLTFAIYSRNFEKDPKE